MTPLRRWQILAGFVALFAVVGTVLGRTDFIPERRALDYFPLEVAGYVGRHAPVSNEALRMLDLTDYLSRNYVKEGLVINVYVGFHGSQQRGSILHSPQHCLPANGWYIAERERVPLPGGPPDTQVNRLRVAYGTDESLVYYWYQGRGRIVAGEYRATLYRALDAGMRNRTDEALVRFITQDGGEESERRLREFIAAVVPLLPPYLPE